MLSTVAPLSKAQMMPAARSVVLPVPALLITWIGMSRASRAKPDTPIPLSVTALTMPATCVPCRATSAGSVPLTP